MVSQALKWETSEGSVGPFSRVSQEGCFFSEQQAGPEPPDKTLLYVPNPDITTSRIVSIYCPSTHLDSSLCTRGCHTQVCILHMCTWYLLPQHKPWKNESSITESMIRYIANPFYLWLNVNIVTRKNFALKIFRAIVIVVGNPLLDTLTCACD